MLRSYLSRNIHLNGESSMKQALQLLLRIATYPHRYLLTKAPYRLLGLGMKNNNKLILRYLIPVLLLEFISIFFLFQLNGVRGSLYDSIQQYNVPGIWHSVGIFVGIALILVFVDGYLGFFINRLSFEFRNGITSYVLSRFENYEGQPLLAQRVQEDIGKFSTTVCELSATILRAVIKLPIFLAVIVGLTHWYTGAIILVTTVLGTYITRKVAQRLVPLQAEQEGNEANFRTTPNFEMFRVVKAQFLLINHKLKMLSFTTSGLQQIFVLLPFILLLPLYIAKELLMGPFMQAVDALGKIIDSLLVLIDNRQMIVQMESTLTRLRFLVPTPATPPTGHIRGGE